MEYKIAFSSPRLLFLINRNFLQKKKVTLEIQRKERLIRKLKSQLKKAETTINILKKTSIRRFKLPIMKGFYLNFDSLTSPTEDTEGKQREVDEKIMNQSNPNFINSDPHNSYNELFSEKETYRGDKFLERKET